MKCAFFSLAVSVAAAMPVAALDLGVPIGALSGSDYAAATTTPLPDQPFTRGATIATSDGDVIRRAYRVPGGTLTTLQLLAPLETALEEAGFRIEFTCLDDACGGFDFRTSLDLLPEPDMHVDLGDFRYLLARRDDTDPHSVAIVASRSADAGFIHITEVSARDLTADVDPAETEAPLPVDSDVLLDRLVANGRVVLEGLDFESGAAELTDPSYEGLQTLADWLARTPGARVVLVGHTDAVGSLEGNTALSQRRAQAVVDVLVTNYGVDAGQLSASGAGYLAPRASNLSDTGRAANRRVEVVLLEVQ